MRKCILLILLTFFAICSLRSQETGNPESFVVGANQKITGKYVNDSITIVRRGKYLYNAQRLKRAELGDLLRTNDAAYKEYKKSKPLEAIGVSFAMFSGFCIGYPLGQAISGYEPSWGVVGVGVGCLAIALPLAFAADNKVANSIRIYNRGLKTANLNRLELKVIYTGTAVGIFLRF